MALTTDEQTQILAIIAREGGLPAVVGEIQTLGIANQKASDLSMLAGSITITVGNWTTVTGFVPTASSATQYTLIADIKTALTAHDATNLGPLLLAFYASSKANLGQ
jgi:hypothetical protein